MMWNGYYMGMGYGPLWGIGTIFSIIWWLVIIFLIVSFVRWMKRDGVHKLPFEKTPIDILKERYAKGEINKAEFEEKMKDLGGSST